MKSRPMMTPQAMPKMLKFKFDEETLKKHNEDRKIQPKEIKQSPSKSNGKIAS